ncbi:MAG: hypothetical protein DRI56_13310, partial [Chloroflexota bacterium]
LHNFLGGNYNQEFDVPSGTFTGTGTKKFYARWRVTPDANNDGSCDDGDEGNTSYDGYVKGGEVEDYRWEFNMPTSVTVSSLEAHSPWLTSPYTLGAAVLLLVVTMGGVVLVQRRKA